MRNKVLLSLFAVTSVYAAISLNSYKEVQGVITYDVKATIEGDKSVSDFTGADSINYYEFVNITTIEGGTYEFTKYSSDLTDGNTDTALLIYNDPNATLVIDEPWAFYTNDDFFFGGGQESVRNLTNETTSGSTGVPFATSLTLDPNTDYTAVLMSFSPNVTGSLDFTISGGSAFSGSPFGVVPESKDTGMIIAIFVAGMVGYCYFKSKPSKDEKID